MMIENVCVRIYVVYGSSGRRRSPAMRYTVCVRVTIVVICDKVMRATKLSSSFIRYTVAIYGVVHGVSKLFATLISFRLIPFKHPIRPEINRPTHGKSIFSFSHFILLCQLLLWMGRYGNRMRWTTGRGGSKPDGWTVLPRNKQNNTPDIRSFEICGLLTKIRLLLCPLPC